MAAYTVTESENKVFPWVLLSPAGSIVAKFNSRSEAEKVRDLLNARAA